MVTADRVMDDVKEGVHHINWLVSDGNEIYDYALEGRKIIHLRCEFHIKMNIAKYERLLEKEDRGERRKIRANIRANEAILKTQERHRKWWKRRFGTDWITNNAVEGFTRSAKGNLRRIVSFQNIGYANSYLSLYSLYWNFQKGEILLL